jgi:hypothetical protein
VPGLERLPVSVSETELHAIDTAESFAAPGRFLVAVTNHGRDAHVHLSLDEGLAGVARVEETNVYVPRDGTREVEVAVDPGVGHATGTLVVETGYGARRVAVDVEVGSPEGDPVPVDERLGHPAEGGEGGGDPSPPPRDGGGDGSGLGTTATDPSLPSGTVSVGVLALVALVVAVGVAAVVNDPVVIAGVVVVLVGVLAAAVMLVR